MSAPGGAVEFRHLLRGGGGVSVVGFHLGGELHGCDVRLVEEVVARGRIHPLPDLPPEVPGVLLLRGELVPVLDVAPALGLVRERGAETAVLVVDGGDVRIGIAADRLDEVTEVPSDALRPAPLTGGDRDPYVAAVARVEAGLMNLIDLAELLRERTTLEMGEQR